MWLCVFGYLLAAWWPVKVRSALVDYVGKYRVHLALIAVAIAAVAMALNVPILLGEAIQFDGSRNADSFTFVSSARYMAHHAFYGDGDFNPSRPVYSILRSYFGEGAIQPRPAAEGLLAWLGATFDADPMYLYNGLLTAGMLLGGLSIMAFLPEHMALSPERFALLLPLMLACPTLLFVAINSNFANAFMLAPATVYVALGGVQRRWGTFVAGVIAVGCLMSGYPELLLFVGLMRFFAVVGRGIVTARFLPIAFNSGLLLLEVLASCALFPWAAKSALIVYRTTLGVSRAGASDQVGNMYAGVPAAIVAAAFLLTAWNDLKRYASGERLRTLFAGVLLAFTAAQLLMVIRGYPYGGFKIAEYFVTVLSAMVMVCGAIGLSVEAGASRTRMQQSRLVLIASTVLAVLWQDVRLLKRSWAFAEDRQVTHDLVAAGRWMQRHIPNGPVALGHTSASFYYGHWVPYVTGAHLVYDWADPDAAGYLSPYLREAETVRFSDAQVLLFIDDIGMPDETPDSELARFGRIHLVCKPSDE
ncbi:hypothetical protein GCM10010872_16540 [Dyella flava]|nr:hypothetical protein GCM10010872_16540 [Dyella flava]